MGLLDGILDDPSTAGLLGMSAGLLNAGGPSLMPHSFGQALAAGMQSGMGAYNTTKQAQLDRQKEMMQMGMLQQQFMQAQRRNTMIDNWLAGNNPDGSPSTAPQAAPDPVSVGLSQGGQAGDIGPTPTNLARVQAIAANPPPVASAPQSGGLFGGLPRDVVMSDLAFGGGANISKYLNERTAPVEAVKSALQLGIPLSTVRDSQIADLSSKGMVPVRPGGTILRNGIPYFTAPTTEGQYTTWDAQGNPVSNLVPNAAEVTQALERSKAAGKASVKPIKAYIGTQPVFTNELEAATGGYSADPTAPRWTGGVMSPSDMKTLQQAAAAGNSDAKMALDAYNAAQSGRSQSPRLTPDLAPGVEKSIGGNVDTMNSDFADLYASNKSAPVTLAILDNIKKLAPKAIAGNNADRLAYMNGLLTLGGLQPAKDLASATDLLNKNANMLAINMRLGASGGGSDALQSLAQAANPNSHMQPDAIIKAADEVAGQVRMKQDMYNKLLPYKMKNDVQGYYGAQQQFSQSADPRNYHAPASGGKTASLADIAATAKASGKSTAQVTADLKAAGYSIGGQ